MPDAISRGMKHLLAATFILAIAPSLCAGTTAPASTDLTSQFVQSGIPIRGLRVVEVGGIVVLRGETEDPANSLAASQYAQSLGHSRVANLIRIVDVPDDAKIERVAERELATRTLDGCSFHVDSNRGVVTVDGKVRYELQKDIAMSILRGIDGVREIRASLQR